jgi:hypothetical protein
MEEVMTERFKTLVLATGLCVVVAAVSFIAGASARPHESEQTSVTGSVCSTQFSWERVPVATLPADEYATGFVEFE